MTAVEIGQLFMVGIPATGDLAAVREMQPGAVILMGRNAGTPAQTHRLTRSIRDACTIPPLIAVDQEGGRVQRLVDGFTKIPPMRDVGARGGLQVGLMAMTVAAELRAAGIGCNLAPVCDVPVHEKDTVIADRSFSADPIRASLLAAEYIRGAQPTVLCCAKHFPGHGGVGVDSHHALPVFEGSRDDLTPHLQPFHSAIAAGVDSIMIGHISVPVVDESGDPATLSHPIVTGLLREEMHFRGLVMTDDLEMKALDQSNPGDLAIRALAAGVDMLMFCHSPEKARAARDAVLSAVEDGRILPQRVRDALERVRWIKHKYGLVGE